MNTNWAINGITITSTDTNTVRNPSDTNDSGVRAPWQWGKINKVNFSHSSECINSILLNIIT